MTKQQAFYFDEPRLRLNFIERATLRIVKSSIYFVLIIATPIMILQLDIKWLQTIGIFIALVLIDDLLFLGKAKEPIGTHIFKERVNLTRCLNKKAYELIEQAFDRAALNHKNYYFNLLIICLNEKDIQEGISRMDLDINSLKPRAQEQFSKLEQKIIDKKTTMEQIESLIKYAYYDAVISLDQYVSAKNLFGALSKIDDNEINKFFSYFDIQVNDVANALIFGSLKKYFLGFRSTPASLVGFIGRSFRIRHRVINRAWTSKPTPVLDAFSQDITDLARLEHVGFLIGHKDEYDQLLDVLSRETRPNVILLGGPSIGKETIVNHLAYQISRDRVPPQLFDKRLVKLDIGALMAGADQGELIKRASVIANEILVSGNLILYIPDIHNLAKTAEKTIMNLVDVFLPVFKGTTVQIIGTTDPKDYKRYVEPNPEFAATFEKIEAKEITQDEANKFLVFESIFLERQYKTKIGYAAIKTAVSIASKYFRNKYLPSSAEDLLKEALADASQKNEKMLTPEMVISIAQRKTNIPLQKTTKIEAEKLLNLEQIIHKSLIDQDEAVGAVSKALRQYRAGLSRKGGPIAAFLFVGPTGVGKTELSKILANIQFGSEEQMVRFDMSEYQDKQSIFRFIGAPGSDTTGQLTDAILAKPYSLILLDEFEKAYPDILNLFLQVFDDGRLTDNLGRTVNFQNTIIIATSNADSEFIKTEIEKGRGILEIAEDLKKRLTKYFKPELINRFSDIIVFKNLSPDDIFLITKLQAKNLAKTLAEQGLALSLSENAIKEISRLGYDPVFGARPLRKVLSDKIKDKLSEMILKNEIAKGSGVSVDFKEEKFVFEKS